MSNQKELDSITQEIAKLESRRKEFETARMAAQAAITERESTLGKSMIADKKIDDDLQFISRERVRADGLENASAQLTQQLEAAQTKRAEIELAIAAEEYEQTSLSVKSTVISALRDLISADKKLQTVPAYGPPRGYSPSKETRLIKDALGLVLEMDLYRKLIDYQDRIPSFMQEAKDGR